MAMTAITSQDDDLDGEIMSRRDFIDPRMLEMENSEQHEAANKFKEEWYPEGIDPMR